MQNTDEWFAARMGHITASRAGDILKNGRGKGQPSQMLETYALELAADRLAGTPEEEVGFANADWGHEMEPHARLAYEVRTGSLVTEVDFIKHQSIPWVGCSPDGLVGDDGGLELKCPAKRRRHLEVLLLDNIPDEYVAQVQFSLLVTGRDWWDFGSYHPHFPEGKQLFVRRVFPDPPTQTLLQQRIGITLARVEQIISQIQGQ